MIDVLLGTATEKIARHRHERLSVFGIGTELELPSGDTRFTAQLSDDRGNVGNQMQLIVRVP